MDRETALRKIQKCLNLSKSPEPHEAARALRQAQALMEEFNVEYPELLSAGVTEGTAPSRATKRPPQYEMRLAHTVADSFGCSMFFSQGDAHYEVGGAYTFVGVGAAADVASYTFAVLARKLQAARAEYTKTKLARYKKNKIPAADLFCDGWVMAVAGAVPAAIGDDSRDASLTAYITLTYPDLGELTPRQRQLAKPSQAVNHMVSGYIEGKKAHFNAGIGNGHAERRSLSMGSQ